MRDNVMISLQNLLQSLLSENDISRRLVIEDAILDHIEVALTKYEPRLPKIVKFGDDMLKIEKKEHLEKLLEWLRGLVRVASIELQLPRREGFIVYHKTPFKKSLIVQSVLIQLLQGGLFGEEATFKLSVDLIEEGRGKGTKGTTSKLI